jgi:hypothetical protein
MAEMDDREAREMQGRTAAVPMRKVIEFSELPLETV